MQCRPLLGKPNFTIPPPPLYFWGLSFPTKKVYQQQQQQQKYLGACQGIVKALQDNEKGKQLTQKVLDLDFLDLGAVLRDVPREWASIESQGQCSSFSVGGWCTVSTALNRLSSGVKGKKCW